MVDDIFMTTHFIQSILGKIQSPALQPFSIFLLQEEKPHKLFIKEGFNQISRTQHQRIQGLESNQKPTFGLVIENKKNQRPNPPIMCKSPAQVPICSYNSMGALEFMVSRAHPLTCWLTISHRTQCATDPIRPLHMQSANSTFNCKNPKPS